MRTPTYIVKNHDGIFYFRYVIPKKFKHLFPNNKREFRSSLKTRSRRIALQEARKRWVAINEKNSSPEIANNQNPLPQNESFVKSKDLRLSELVVKFINDKTLNVTKPQLS